MLLQSFSLGFTVTALTVLVAAILPGVSAVDELGPVIAASAVAGFMLLLLIVIIVFAMFFASKWMRISMKSEGKVKMSRSYFKKKKEAKRRLVNGSMRSSRLTQDTYVAPPSVKPLPLPVVNGNIPPVTAVDKETLVQGWNQNTRKVYEEKGYTMELGEEQDEEFQIETTLVDNEVLDVGPYKNMQVTSAKPVDGNVYNNPYIYTNNDRVTITRSSDQTGMVSSMSSGAGPDVAPGSNDLEAIISPSIDDKIIKL